MPIAHPQIIILLCALLALTSCSEEKTQVEALCDGKPDYGRCVTDIDYFISLTKINYYGSGLLAETFDRGAARFNQYANRWLGNTQVNRSILVRPHSEDVFLDPMEAMSLFAEPRKSKAEEIASSIYLFDGHFVTDIYSEDTNQVSLYAYPLSGKKHISISSFGFGTKEQLALNFCMRFRQYRLPKGEFQCPATFIVSSEIVDKGWSELVYHLEAIKYPSFDKADYLQKVEFKEIQRLKNVFEQHQVAISDRNKN